MATQAYYRKWRSQTFAELVGQEHVTRTLQNAVRSGRIAHAYVFSGPRGVGKTSAARLLAKAVNCLDSQDGEPCNECISCHSIAEGRALDVIEIDAASNNGVDQIRDLAEKVNFLPSEAHYKFYILDEAHMLTGAAANAFLKTLEEPPAHTVFVLATTDAQRLPATILSRCQRLEFRRIVLPAMLRRLNQICAGEGIRAEPAALDLIARGATGSLRDAEGLLDQVVAYGGKEISAEQVRAIVGLAGSEAAIQLAGHLADGDLAGGLRLINSLVDRGTDPRYFNREVVDCLRGLLLLKAGDSLADLLDATPEMVEQLRALAARLTPGQVLQWLRAFAPSEPPGRILGPGQLPLELAFVDAVLGPTAPATQPAAPPALARAAGEAIARPPEPAPARRLADYVRASAEAPGASAGPRSAGEAESARPASRPATSSASPAAGQSIVPTATPTAMPPTGPVPSAEPIASPAGSPPPPAPTTPEPTSRAGRMPPAEPREPIAAPAPRRAPAAAGPALALPEVVAKWPEVVDRFGAANRSVQALLRDVTPIGAAGSEVTLGCRFGFHRDRLNDDRTRASVENVLGQVLGQACRIRLIVDTGEAAREAQPAADPMQSLASDPLTRAAVSLGWRVTRIEKDQEVIYDAQSQDDPAAPGPPAEAPGGAG